MRKSKDEGVDARNRDYSAYDQVAKAQDYRFAEAQGEERFDEETTIATCDMRSASFAAELGAALEDIGFAILTGHGIDPTLYERCAAEVVRVFTGHPLAAKLRFRAQRCGSVNQGYFAKRETSDIHPDLVEGWVFCRRAFLMPGGARASDELARFWPDASHEAVFRELCLAHEALIAPIMQAILRHLGCDPHLYDARLREPSIGLRLNYYPPLDAADVRSGAGRLLGHEDVDLFTLLPAPRGEGLQVLNRRNFRWIRLDAPPGSIILNTGDYMQRITNDRLPSTTHRVSQPRSPAARAQERVSFPLNVYLREDDLLEVLPGLGPAKYPPIKAIEFHTRTTAKYYGDDYAVSG
jgi:isopenicillin N synthase-like dioxygenase